MTTKQAIYLNHAKKLICYIGRPYGLVFVTRLKQVGFFVFRVHRHIGGLENANRTSSQSLAVHRHIGGLEICLFYGLDFHKVHRHIGGLEMWALPFQVLRQVHRHIGGLENV